jgi:hypothetical protein
MDDGRFVIATGRFYACYGRLSVIGFKDIRGMDVPGRFPCVVAFWVAFPFYEILQGLVTSEVSVITNLFHFIFRFSVDKVRWWSGEVGAVCGGFAIGR